MNAWKSLLLVGSLAACATSRSSDSSADARAQFERLKMLEGSWMATTLGRTAPIRYRLVSGGNVLLEDMFPGTEHEMVTMYHLDGDALVLTHYCMLGNQPAMRALPTGADGSITFECSGGTNMRSEKDAHMHACVFHVIEANRAEATWTLFENGEPREAAHFAIVRETQ